MKLRYLFAALCLCLLLASPAAAAGGSGTAADPYIIQTAAELQSMQNNLAAYYQLGVDIDLSSVSWSPIGSESSPFSGQFDGSGYTIKNLVLNPTTSASGFFGSITSGAVIKDVTFQDCIISSSNQRSAIVIGSVLMTSTTQDTAIISNVNCVRCSVSGYNNYVGCLIGYIAPNSAININNCDISYCKAECTDTGNTACLIGACGGASMEISNCDISNSYARSNTFYAGGIISEVFGASLINIDSCTVSNSIIECKTQNPVGGIIGACGGASTVEISNCDVLNSVVKGATTYVGGICGRSWQSGSIITINMCDVIGCTISASSMYAGGICGRVTEGTTGTFSNCNVKDSTIISPSYAATICPAFS